MRHRHLLYRDLGGWKFQDVSKQAGLDTASSVPGFAPETMTETGYPIFTLRISARICFSGTMATAVSAKWRVPRESPSEAGALAAAS